MGRPYLPYFHTKSSMGIKDFAASGALQPHALIQMQYRTFVFVQNIFENICQHKSKCFFM